MKATNKTIVRLIVGCVLAYCLSRFTNQTFAIEGLHVSVVSSNAILSWPSTTNETYIVQYCSNLNAISSWVTLTNYFPPTDDTNLTFFVYSNSVFYPPGETGGTNSGGVPDPTGTNNPSSTGTNIFNSTTGFYRVVRDGVHMYGITNGMVFSNELATVIEFAVDSTDQVVGVTFYDENNSPIIGASTQPYGSNAWLLVWNTTIAFNGDYNIYAELDFASDNPVISPPVSVTVNNIISFPNYFSQVYGDQMWIYAQTIPNASYEIDMYDENTNYLGTFSDSADGDGVISFLWDLTDGSGNTFDSTNFFGVFTVDTSSSSVRSEAVVKSLNAPAPSFQTTSLAKKTFGYKTKSGGIHPNTPSSSASANQLWSKEPSWTPNNNWVVAYGLFNGQSGESSENDVNMICGGPSGEYGGVLGTLDQYGLNGNLSPGNSAENGTVFTVDDAPSRANLLSYLPGNYRNFYFFGHGNNTAIGSYNGFVLTLDQIAFALGNTPLSYANPGLSYNSPVTWPTIIPPTVNTQIKTVASHPYRFVLIDACDTAAGNFSQAFAIPSITVSTNFFATAGVESRAFVGFTSWKLNLNFLSWESYSELTGFFLADWLTHHDIQTCVGNAQNDAHTTGAYMDSSAVIYGAYDLKIDTRTRP